MKQNNWINRIFFKEEILEQERMYEKYKLLLLKYPELFDQVVNAKNLMELFKLHKQAWLEGFQNKILSSCKWGNFRSDSITTMTPEDVYLGNVYGLWTYNIPKWEMLQEEIYGFNGFGIPRDTKVYDLILDQYKTILKCGINTVKAEADDFITRYEEINEV